MQNCAIKLPEIIELSLLNSTKVRINTKRQHLERPIRNEQNPSSAIDTRIRRKEITSIRT